jgi:uncharacterized protein YycO
MKMLKILGFCALVFSIFSQPVFASSLESSTKNEEKVILKEQRAELREMWDNHQVEVTEFQTLGIDPGYTGIGSKGDILIALDSVTDHVAIVKDTYTVIEAHPDNPNGVNYRDNNWKERYSEIKGMRVDGATTTNKTNAVNYATAQLYEPYSIFSGRWTESDWYCSKLVWRAWYNQGFNVEGKAGEAPGTHVTPGDILDSPLTTVFYSSF